MTKIQFLLSLALFSLTVVPAVAADKFECPSPFKPNTPAKLEQIKGLLPNANAMANINQLSDTIATLRRDGMSKATDRRSSYRCLLSNGCSRSSR